MRARSRPRIRRSTSCSENSGETKDEPAPEDHPNSGAPGRREPRPPSRGGKAGADKLGEKDKDLDARLEELTGRKKKQASADQERTGPVGEMIKEMRDVEQRLGKPDPSEDTQKKQKQIVKRDRNHDRTGEAVRFIGRADGHQASAARPGQQPGQQPGDRTGAQAQGAPPMKPAKPTDPALHRRMARASGAICRTSCGRMMEATFKEAALDAKKELIDRYFLSVAKGKLRTGGVTS